jgi:hypothetical protein
VSKGLSVNSTNADKISTRDDFQMGVKNRERPMRDAGPLMDAKVPPDATMVSDASPDTMTDAAPQQDAGADASDAATYAAPSDPKGVKLLAANEQGIQGMVKSGNFLYAVSQVVNDNTKARLLKVDLLNGTISMQTLPGVGGTKLRIRVLDTGSPRIAVWREGAGGAIYLYLADNLPLPQNPSTTIGLPVAFTIGDLALGGQSLVMYGSDNMKFTMLSVGRAAIETGQALNPVQLMFFIAPGTPLVGRVTAVAWAPTVVATDVGELAVAVEGTDVSVLRCTNLTCTLPTVPLSRVHPSNAKVAWLGLEAGIPATLHTRLAFNQLAAAPDVSGISRNVFDDAFNDQSYMPAPATGSLRLTNNAGVFDPTALFGTSYYYAVEERLLRYDFGVGGAAPVQLANIGPDSASAIVVADRNTLYWSSTGEVNTLSNSNIYRINLP